MSVTIKVFADLGVTGLAGTAGFTTRLVSDNTLVQSRAASVATVAINSEGTTYHGTFPGTDGVDYLVTWDDGAGTPNYLPGYVVNTTPQANVTQIAGVAARQGDGTAAAVTAGTITLDATDPANASNLTGWTVHVLSAATGAGQVATITSSNPSTHAQTLSVNWATTPTGTVIYELIPPANLGAGSISATTFAAGAIAASTFAVNAITAAAVAPGALTASAFAANALDGLAFTAAAVTKFQAGLATPTNITAGTITTVTNLTNAATSGDFTAAQKTSLNAATPTVFVAPSGLNNVIIETNYNLKQAMKVILATVANNITGNGTTTVTVGNAALPTPTTGANTVVTATMTGVVLVNGVPTAVDRTAIPSIQLSTT